MRLISRNYGRFAEHAETLVYQRAWERDSVRHPAANPAQQSSGQRAGTSPGVTQALLGQLTAMGFNHNRATRACLATNSAGEWLCYLLAAFGSRSYRRV